MNRQIRVLTIASLCLLLALMANITYVQYFKQSEYNKKADNARVILEGLKRQRGEILAGSMVIAKSVPSKDGFNFLRVYGNKIDPKYAADAAAEYAPVTGYLTLGADWGTEQAQNSILSGTDDRLFIDRVSDLLNNNQPQGGNVELTIDPKVQDAAYQGLASRGFTGAAVAIDPTTGKILAMASTPSYDPNRVASHDASASAKAYAEILKSNALLNRGAQRPLFPGSTFKLVTAAAAIQDLHMNPQSLVNGNATTTIQGTNRITQNEDKVSCGFLNQPQVSFMTALDYSCNVAFAEIGARLSADQLTSMADSFGFNTNPFLDVWPSSASSYPNETDKALRALSAYGQLSVQATPLQMAMVAAAIGNHGKLMKPYMINRLTSPTLDVISQTQPTALSNPISGSTADQLTQMMVDVVNRGTGTRAQIPGISVAGKTGTAETGTGGSPYAWFVSFGPSDNAKIAIAVLVESSSTVKDNVAGGALCAPIAKAMMQAYLSETGTQ
ncbi:penicillin-binding protein [Nocardioides baekrokdamisoli]|uniref:Penicillin-binding protein n=1 Tax=Nocardioides baekrokdamisoli TaxID=1804624 RepID=A0A3G9IY66_9ACTN|nr:penicillin-binding transpeptidase domain-containing protein [Nocardioides baekrokdamisoli]BBH17353.1 penicillin-binding protein [Nocardioides baekrokdamisoli]